MNENQLENDYVLKWFTDYLKYSYELGADISPEGRHSERAEFRDVVLVDRLREAVSKFNPMAGAEKIEEVVLKVTDIPGAKRIDKNQQFHQMLINGVELDRFGDDKDEDDHKLRIIDFQNPKNNDFLVVNQFTIIGSAEHRPDLIVFINGLPMVVIELKNPDDTKTDIWQAYNQLETYKERIPDLFIYNMALIISDGYFAKIGSLTADSERYMPWRYIPSEKENMKFEFEAESLVKGFFNKELIIDFINNFCLYSSDEDGRLFKLIAGYHQYHGVRVTLENIVKVSAPDGSKKGGVFWHTQGSGKSLSMTCLTGLISKDPRLENPTVVIVTDRNDLDGQLYETFCQAKFLLNQTPLQADGRDELREILLKSKSGGIFFSTIQKFATIADESVFPVLSNRHNVVVLVDEAHRTQYGLSKKLDKKTNTYKSGYALNLRKALPNATFVAFTGTPIDQKEKMTIEVFGDYVSIYDIQDAKIDGATVPILYQPRLAKLQLKEAVEELMDEEIDELFEDDEISFKEKEKTKWAGLEKVVGAEGRIKEIAKDLVAHFTRRNDAIEGKAMVVCMSRDICVQMYNELVAIFDKDLKEDDPRHWHSKDPKKGKIKVIMTGAASDEAKLIPHLYSKQQKKDLEKRFKKSTDELKIVIVCDMWLTGFDAPACHTMYIDKPMHDHNLMQAIARVNRVFKDKQGGLVVDYIGIARELKNATVKYTKNKGKGKVTTDPHESFKVLQDKIDVIRKILHEVNYKKFKTEAKECVMNVANFLLNKEDDKKRFADASLAMTYAYTLCSTLEEVEKYEDEIAFYQAVRALFNKSQNSNKNPAKRDSIIKQIINNSIIPEGIEDIFSLAGLKQPDISILSDDFLADLKKMEQKNYAVELLRRLLNDEISSKFKTNIVQEKRFSERLINTLNAYRNRTIESAQVIEELIRLAKELSESISKGSALGLNEDERAFYDALANDPESARELGDEILKKIAHELTERIRKKATIDWQKKESVQANLRIEIKSILRKYKYPPSKQPEAIELVLDQAKALATEWSNQEA